jgi:hypothetical protein
MAVWCCVAALGVWGLSGMVMHAFTFGPETRHDPLGYLLSVFPGPFVLYYWKTR